MNFNEYQRLAYATATRKSYPKKIIFPAIGLGEEAGEVLGKIKKLWRNDRMKLTPKKRTELKKELGDALWYLNAIATDLGLTLDDVATTNLKKARSRKKRGKINGSGDNR